jgi:tetratricopeptide (TPR) repeat protein
MASIGGMEVSRRNETGRTAQHTLVVLNAINLLSLLYCDQGKLAEAEEMYQRALQGYEKELGPEHTSTLDTVKDLLLLYGDLGNMDEAEKILGTADSHSDNSKKIKEPRISKFRGYLRKLLS